MVIPSNLVVWTVAIAVIVGILVRPFKLPEALWAVIGGAVLLISGVLSWHAGLVAIGKGTDVYLFLAGMMLLSETARREGVFDWVAAIAVTHARGSPKRLFLLVYGLGVIVTTFMSNDATAVVFTPAVFAAAKRARVEPLPYLFSCALIANAASFVLPISNPANIVLYGDHTPPLGEWLASFALPSLASIAVTYFVLRWRERSGFSGGAAVDDDRPALSAAGWTALGGIGVTAAALITVSALDLKLGLPTFVLGAATTAATLVSRRASPLPMLSQISWSVLPLVAGLFVLVEAVDGTGLTRLIAATLADITKRSPEWAAAGAGATLAVGSNLINNLPAGLITSTALANAHAPKLVVDTLLIGVDLGPNLSITGSLATILWLTAIRREGEDVGFWRFLKEGAVVMPPALIAAIGVRLLVN